MKLRKILVTALAPMVLLTGCDNIFGLDNYDEPDSMLSGQITYNGQPVNVRTGGIELELWQPGFDLLNKINVFVSQDGTYSSSLFAGDYKLNAIRNQGPWLLTDDTVRVTVSGETTANFPVTPFFIVNNPTFAFVAPTGTTTGGRVNATFSIQQIVTGTGARQVEWAGLYVSKTAFADRTNREVQVETSRANLPATYLTAPVTLGVNLPANIKVTPSPDLRTHVFARVGIKVQGINEMIFSPLMKLAI